MTLRELQELLWRAIAWPTGVRDFLDRCDDATRCAFEAVFAGTEGFDRVARVNVYAEGYFWRLHGVVVDQLALTHWLAGADRFHDFVTDYVLQHPSRDPDVRRFAAGIPAALREHALGRAIPGLDEVAAIEAAIIAAVDGPDDALLGPDDLSAIPPEAWPALRLHAVRTAALLPCRLDFAALASAKATGEAAPSPVLVVDPPAAILVWRRPDLEVHTRAIEPDEAAALRALLPGVAFADLCAAAGEVAPERVVGWLHRWLRDGLLAARD